MNNLLPIAASCLLAGGAIGYVIGNTGEEKAPSENVAEKFVRLIRDDQQI